MRNCVGSWFQGVQYKKDVHGFFMWGSKLRNCVKVEVAVLGPVPNKPTVSVDVKQHFIIVFFTVACVLHAEQTRS